MTRIAKSPPSRDSLNQVYHEAGLPEPFPEDDIWAFLEEDPWFQQVIPEADQLIEEWSPHNQPHVQDEPSPDSQEEGLPTLTDLAAWVSEAINVQSPRPVQADSLAALVAELGIDVPDDQEDAPAPDVPTLYGARDSGDPTDVMDDKDGDDEDYASPAPILVGPRVPLTWDPGAPTAAPLDQLTYSSIRVAPLRTVSIRGREVFRGLRCGVISHGRWTARTCFNEPEVARL